MRLWADSAPKRQIPLQNCTLPKMDRETNYFVILPNDGEVPTKASFYLLKKLFKIRTFIKY